MDLLQLNGTVFSLMTTWATACHHPSAPRALVPLRREDARRGVDLGGTYEVQAVVLREGQIGRKLHLPGSENHSGSGGVCYFGIFGQIGELWYLLEG